MAGNSKNMTMDKATAENFYSNFWKRHQYNSIEFKDLLMGILQGVYYIITKQGIEYVKDSVEATSVFWCKFSSGFLFIA